ncbi:MAG: ABC transporter permease, partial [Elusimicrobia bacterium]|nr:ABC transporter permease [Elusimicrobiota bacterium]
MSRLNSLSWLARRELAARKRSFAAGAALIALATALSVGLQAVSGAREAAVAGQLRELGPALHLLPDGNTALDLARFDLGPGTFTPEDLSRFRGLLSVKGARLQERLLLQLPVDGVRTPAAGLFGGAADDARRAELGSALAQRTGKRADDALNIGGEEFTVGAVRPETAGPDDSAVFLPALRLQELTGRKGPNDIGVFLAPGSAPADAARELRAARPDIAVVAAGPAGKGMDAGRDMLLLLGNHRRFLHAYTGALVALMVLLWTHLGACERRVETAALAAIGCSGGALLALQTLR